MMMRADLKRLLRHEFHTFSRSLFLLFRPQRRKAKICTRRRESGINFLQTKAVQKQWPWDTPVAACASHASTKRQNSPLPLRLQV